MATTYDRYKRGEWGKPALNGGKEMTRKYTNKILEMIDDGLLSNEHVVMMCMKAMSEDDVKWMFHSNELGE